VCAVEPVFFYVPYRKHLKGGFIEFFSFKEIYSNAFSVKKNNNEAILLSRASFDYLFSETMLVSLTL
jgi:hypothetical protein